jgi:hypothetical protein
MAADEYRRNAIECLRIADETISARSRVLLIHMAESWMRLSQQAEKNLTTVYETPPGCSRLCCKNGPNRFSPKRTVMGHRLSQPGGFCLLNLTR